ncbi:hypothetical protein E1162_11515 [Rhodobacteraceae bacterium RKSG542]|uniref:hypothetical protein n=1 Tax=Pseudovibrio flavus TaxID=2529854 RepID=UPI0012BBDE16|nr:hypothetical protein [Pseudovibrio flavus]MTI17865.1 hypothetical protein [Pseudovibrio flavus]
MIRASITALLLFLALSPSYAASDLSMGQVDLGTTAKLDKPSLPQNAMDAPDGFKVTTPTLLTYYTQPDEASQGHQTLLPPNAEVTPIEWVKSEKNGKLVRLGIDIDELGEAEYPSDIYISESDYSTLPLTELNTLSLMEDTLLGLDEGEVYDEAVETEEASRRRSARGSRRNSRGMTYCYRYVKKALLKKGLVESYLPGRSAYMAKSELPKHGFKRLRVSHPDKAKDGSVCVYDRDRRNVHGHIEIKRNDDCYWYGYGCKAKSMYDSRDFYDCYSKSATTWFAKSSDTGKRRKNSVRSRNARFLNDEK